MRQNLECRVNNHVHDEVIALGRNDTLSNRYRIGTRFNNEVIGSFQEERVGYGQKKGITPSKVAKWITRNL